jgi:putative hemolysin
MVVNVSYFSVSTVVGLGLGESGPWAVALFGLASLAGVVVFGEVVPKVLAVNLNAGYAQMAALPLEALGWILWPVQFVLTRIVQVSSRLLRLHRLQTSRLAEDELKILVDLSARRGLLTASERELIAEVVEFGQIKVAEVMTPRVDVPAFDIADPFAQLRELLLHTAWQKIPVYEDRIDNILGIIHAKDVLLAEEEQDVRGLIRPVLYVPALAPVEKVLRRFRVEKVHFAIAVDEFGGFDGVVTVEDILEEIVGEIETEYDHEGPLVEQLSPTEYRLAGDLSIREWQELFQVDVDFPGFDTLGGLVLLMLGHIPREGETVDLGQVTLTVERMRRRKIETIRLKTTNGTTD